MEDTEISSKGVFLPCFHPINSC